MSAVRKIGSAIACVLVVGITALAGPVAYAHDGTPCRAKAHACVDLGAGKAWLMSQGKVTYGPAPMSSGKRGYATPTGMFRVTWKNKDHWSKEYDGPMPYAVFFTDNGHAFHQGDIKQGSHGCIRLTRSAAQTFFATLDPGDFVQIAR
ncbi:MAG: L,D-transpeptidase [Haloechinothrix sp.]